MQLTLTERICYSILGLLVMACIVMFIASCGTADGITITVREKLTIQQAPPSNALQPANGQRCDGYTAWYSNNPDDFKNKTLDQIPHVESINRPGPYPLPDSAVIDITTKSGRTTYFKVKPWIYVWTQLAPDTLKGDSTRIQVYSDALSNFASRTYPLQTGDKPAAVGKLD